MNLDDITPQSGERMLTVGRTGSGKTYLNTVLLKNMPLPPVIYDTKVEPKFDALPKSVEVFSPEELVERYNNNVDINADTGEEETLYDYFIVRPQALELIDPLGMDERWLWHHYNQMQGVPAYLDETAQWHRKNEPSIGLMSLLQRGRSKGITLLMSTQRPKMISRSCFTEADKIIHMQLTDRDDRKRLSDIVPNVDLDELLAPHYFRYFSHGMDKSQLFSPLPLDSTLDTGYTDTANVAPHEHVDEEGGVIEWF